MKNILMSDFDGTLARGSVATNWIIQHPIIENKKKH